MNKKIEDINFDNLDLFKYQKEIDKINKICEKLDKNESLTRAYLEYLQRENEKLKEKIDKAIEFIEREFDEYSEFVFGIELKNNILEILKDGDVDECE